MVGDDRKLAAGTGNQGVIPIFAPKHGSTTRLQAQPGIGRKHGWSEHLISVDITVSAGPVELPASPKFVADLPVADVVRHRMTIGSAAFGHSGGGGPVAVFDPAGGFLRRAAPGIDANHRLA